MVLTTDKTMTGKHRRRTMALELSHDTLYMYESIEKKNPISVCLQNIKVQVIAYSNTQFTIETSDKKIYNIQAKSFYDRQKWITALTLTVRQIEVVFQVGKMGISFQGNLIKHVALGSQADKAGVRCGWKILEINGRPQLNNSENIYTDIQTEFKNDLPVKLLFQENRQVMTFQPYRFGFVSELNRVKKVERNTQAHKLGVKMGWYILSI